MESSGPTSEPKLVRALIDTNVVLDLLLDRKPWSDAAQPLWDARDAGRVVAYLPASVLTDIFYIIRRQADIPTAFAAVDQVFAAFGLFAVDGPLLQQARALEGSDFEDNVQIACAINAGLDLIVTRNPTDFRHSLVHVIEPPQIAAYLSAS
jgi:predicted nucleic acid-binding protein